MHASHDDMVFRQDGRGSMIPEERILAETFHEIGGPTDGAILLDGGQRAALEVNEHCFAIGHGGGVASGAIAVFAGIFRSECGAPQFLAVMVERQEGIEPIGGGRDVDGFAKHDWGRAALAGEWGPPLKFLGTETNGKRPFRDGPRPIFATPRRPTQKSFGPGQLCSQQNGQRHEKYKELQLAAKHSS